MRIAIANDDTSMGPGDLDCRFGAAQLAPELLARALAARGHEVWRVSGYKPTVEPGGGVLYVRPTDKVDAVIANRRIDWVDMVEATTSFAWVHDAWGHNLGHFKARPHVRIVAVSLWQARNLATALAGVAVPWGVIPVGAAAELADYAIMPGKRVYTSGMWVECRGTLRAVEAFCLAAHRVQGLALHMYGDEALWGSKRGAYGKKVLDTVAKSGTHIELCGTVPYPEMLKALPRMSIFLHPATAETCWVSGAEAALAGKPIVSRTCAAQGERGYADTTDGSVEQMAERIVAFAEDDDLYRAAARQNRCAARHLTWPAVAAQWEHAIECALGGSGDACTGSGTCLRGQPD